MKSALLEELAIQLKCNFLSELKQKKNLTQLKKILLTTDEKTFSHTEWSYVLSYLLGIPVEVDTPTEAIEILKKDHD